MTAIIKDGVRSTTSRSWWIGAAGSGGRPASPSAVSWNLGLPAVADQVIRDELIDLVFLGRPALSNPHWPVWAARELAHNDPFSLIPEDWSWWLRKRPGPEGSLGWPATAPGAGFAPGTPAARGKA